MNLRNLSEKHLLIITISVTVLLLGGVGYFIYEMQSKYDAEKALNAQLVNTENTIRNEIAAAKKYKTVLDTSEGLKRILNEYMPVKSSDQPGIDAEFNAFTTLRDKLKQSDITYSSMALNVQAATPGSPIVQVYFTIEGMSGNLNQIGTFIDNLETMKPFVKIDYFQINASETAGFLMAGSNPIVRHELKLSACYYMYDPSKVVASDPDKVFKEPHKLIAYLNEKDQERIKKDNSPLFKALDQNGTEETDSAENGETKETATADDGEKTTTADKGEAEEEKPEMIGKTRDIVDDVFEASKRNKKGQVVLKDGKYFKVKKWWEDIFVGANVRVKAIEDIRYKRKLAEDLKKFFESEEWTDTLQNRDLAKFIKITDSQVWQRREVLKSAQLTTVLKAIEALIPAKEEPEKYSTFRPLEDKIKAIISEVESNNGMPEGTFTEEAHGETIANINKKINILRTLGVDLLKKEQHKQLAAELKRIAESDIKDREKLNELIEIETKHKDEYYPEVMEILQAKIAETREKVYEELRREAIIKLNKYLAEANVLIRENPGKVADVVDNAVQIVKENKLSFNDPQIKPIISELISLKAISFVESYYTSRLDEAARHIKIKGYIQEETGFILDLGTGYIKQGSDLGTVLGDVGRGIVITETTVLGSNKIVVGLEMNGRVLYTGVTSE